MTQVFNAEHPPQQTVDPFDALTDKRSGILTHADQAAILAKKMLAGRWVWTTGLGWLGWDGRRWAPQPMEAVRAEIMQWYRLYVDREHDRIIKQAGSFSSLNAEQEKHLRALKGLLSKSSLDAVTALAAGLVLKKSDIFDAHPDLLNVANGVVDLRTGELRTHDPELYMTKLAAADYRPEAGENPGVTKVLECIPDEAVRDWLQVRFGQAVTGYPTPDDVLLVCYGGGSNGKSSFLGSMQFCLGDYAVLIDDKVLLGENGGHSTEKTDLWGARFALVEEAPGGVELDTNMVKKITGSTKIKARRMRMDTVEWQPTHAMFLTCNSQPVVKATDHGTWRRLAKVTFPVRYRYPNEPLEGPDDRRGDPSVRAAAEAHEPELMAGFLAWMVNGARRWYAMNRVMPPIPTTVVQDTLEWRQETDLILSFISEALEFDPSSHVIVTELYDEFKAWMESAGMHAWSLKAFKLRFMEHSEVVGNRVENGRTRNHGNLSRPMRMAHMVVPGGMQTVLNGIAFRREEDHGLRTLPLRLPGAQDLSSCRDA
jgi:putative DNA primase/helicase